eukprot:TRINITY_DN2756_c1_g2_i1.p1 TRINITY_DN2756_c1_g2~~TRINITY_DN2756_c1_g2_i1.p1  ORF type:complete len:286 (-),score=16.84 TRINITY_DN2756_c1_g2_i1:179-931(-)
MFALKNPTYTFAGNFYNYRHFSRRRECFSQVLVGYAAQHRKVSRLLYFYLKQCCQQEGPEGLSLRQQVSKRNKHISIQEVKQQSELKQQSKLSEDSQETKSPSQSSSKRNKQKAVQRETQELRVRKQSNLSQESQLAENCSRDDQQLVGDIYDKDQDDGYIDDLETGINNKQKTQQEFQYFQWSVNVDEEYIIGDMKQWLQSSKAFDFETDIHFLKQRHYAVPMEEFNLDDVFDEQAQLFEESNKNNDED